jgi:hypothetical protein
MFVATTILKFHKAAAGIKAACGDIVPPGNFLALVKSHGEFRGSTDMRGVRI